ncbi:Serine incorporator 3 [Monoraphidium neglectum]|uniref:Serine incorporator 3 n=1 Tax=Monoraphidium neglectum TaxID=145388 RepID=A0A0D2LCD4_9CHLO|nr:Serine incorporator 3 [Monoraphidium neglectum]KIZ04409.1 Serine incorporator 3 [Monoraphidium neglectum]|eukprot:XP_013903428.1 Serine incorporator 3 [Monoraphidium neglectum]
MGASQTVCCLVLRDEHIARSFAVAKWTYCALFTVVTVITWVLRDYSDDWFLKHSTIFAYCQLPGYEALCSGKQVAVRISFANFSFFFTHALVLFWCTWERDFRAGIHTGLWFWKILAWGGAIAGFFFVPANAITVYAQVARYGAGLFLVFVMIEMVSWVYDVNEWLLRRDSKPAWAALVLGAAVSILGGLALIGAAYYFYAATPACHLNLFFITWSIVVGFALVGVLFVPNRLEVAGLMTSGAVFAYCSYLLYSALGRVPGDACVRVAVSDQWVQIVGFFLGIFAVCYSTMSLGTSSIFGGKQSGDSSEAGGGGDTSGGGGDLANDSGPLPYRPDAFHLMFALASMYMAMLFTNWQVSSSTAKFELGTGWTSTWVTMGSKWFCEALYLWTVVAPAILRNRDFS